MEVEIEDLHLQIDDITKAKTAVRGRAHRAGLGTEGQLNRDPHRSSHACRTQYPPTHVLCSPPSPRAVLRGGKVGSLGAHLPV